MALTDDVERGCIEASESGYDIEVYVQARARGESHPAAMWLAHRAAHGLSIRNPHCPPTEYAEIALVEDSRCCAQWLMNNHIRSHGMEPYIFPQIEETA